MKRSIMCRSARYNEDGQMHGMELAGRVWVVLAENDTQRRWERGTEILTSPATDIDEGEEYTRVTTRNTVYIVPSRSYGTIGEEAEYALND
jgi:hypothetical protein